MIWNAGNADGGQIRHAAIPSRLVMSISPQTPGSSVLVLRTSRRNCAVPLAYVSEVMRPLPIEPLAGAPAGVPGMAIIRGRVTPVVDLDALFGDGAPVQSGSSRFVTLRIGDRTVALLVDAVRTIRTFAWGVFESLPPLWQGPHPPAVAALGAVDRELVFVLETARLLPDDWHPTGREGGNA